MDMTAFGIVCFILAVTWSWSRAAGLNCGYLEMTKKVPSKDEFERKFHRTYRSVNISRLECSQRCYGDERCNGMLVCPGVCHLFGVFTLTPFSDPGTYYNTCDVFNINRCKNNGEPDQSGYCRCPRGYGGPFCQTVVQDSCYNQWRLVYDTQTYQNMDEYLMALNSSCKIQAKAIIEDAIIRSMERVHTFGSDIWTESSFHLNKSSWNSFDVNPTRLFIVTKNGKEQSIKAFNMTGSSVSTINSTIVAKWYVKGMSDGLPVLKNDANGTVLDGDINLLISKIENGSTVLSLENLFVDKTTQTVAGDNLKGLGLYLASPYVAYNPPTYWYMYKISTLGARYVLRWKVGEGTIYVADNATVSYTWCTDDCWVRVLTSDQFGNGLQGSPSTLARALLSGHRLRVYTGGAAVSTRAVYIHGHTVSACLEEMMEPIGVIAFSQSGTAVNKIVSSNGLVQTRRYTLETDSVLEELQENQTVNWFVDTREWIQVLSLTGGGQILSGSVTDLRQKVLVGASVRIVVDFTNGVSVIVDADHLEVSSSGHVAADVMNHVNVNLELFTFADYTSFPHVWSAIITTEGTTSLYYYTFKRSDGQHQILSNVDRYTWFVQM